MRERTTITLDLYLKLLLFDQWRHWMLRCRLASNHTRNHRVIRSGPCAMTGRKRDRDKRKNRVARAARGAYDSPR